MPRLSTCKECGLKIHSEEKKVHSGKSYCVNCYNEINKSSEEYKNLIEFICNIFEIDAPTGLIVKQIKDYKNTYKYTYGGITYTLWYAKEILGKTFNPIYGIALVKFNYDEAKNYYIQQENIKNQMEKNSNIEIKTKVVKINKHKSNKNKSLINLEDL